MPLADFGVNTCGEDPALFFYFISNLVQEVKVLFESCCLYKCINLKEALRSLRFPPEVVR